MPNQANKSNMQNTKSSTIKRKGAGSEYHKEHAGNIEGYGQPHPVNGENLPANED